MLPYLNECNANALKTQINECIFVDKNQSRCMSFVNVSEMHEKIFTELIKRHQNSKQFLKQTLKDEWNQVLNNKRFKLLPRSNLTRTTTYYITIASTVYGLTQGEASVLSIPAEIRAISLYSGGVIKTQQGDIYARTLKPVYIEISQQAMKSHSSSCYTECWDKVIFPDGKPKITLPYFYSKE